MKKGFFKRCDGTFVLGILLGVTICCLYGCKSKVTNESNENPTESEDNEIVLGLDVSEYQGDISWQDIAFDKDSLLKHVQWLDSSSLSEQHPISFVVIRATKSKGFVDRKFQENFIAAKENGFNRGAYHFLTDDASGKQQAENFLKVVNLEKGDIPPMLDIESGSFGDVITIAKEWLEVVETRLGVKPILYTNENYYKNVISQDSTLMAHDLWFSERHGQRPNVPNCILWQFSESIHVTGIIGNTVDVSLFYGNADDFRQYIEEKGIK